MRLRNTCNNGRVLPPPWPRQRQTWHGALVGRFPEGACAPDGAGGAAAHRPGCTRSLFRAGCVRARQSIAQQRPLAGPPCPPCPAGPPGPPVGHEVRARSTPPRRRQRTVCSTVTVHRGAVALGRRGRCGAGPAGPGVSSSRSSRSSGGRHRLPLPPRVQRRDLLRSQRCGQRHRQFCGRRRG